MHSSAGLPPLISHWPTTIGESPRSGSEYHAPPTRSVHKGQPSGDVARAFRGVILENNRAVPDVLAQYHFSAPYDEQTGYSGRDMLRFHRGKYRYYASYLCIIGEEWYVVEQRVVTAHSKLATYCECYRCLLSVWNPLRNSYIGHITHCLRLGYTEPRLLARAHQYRSTGQPLDSLGWYVRLGEWVVLVVLIVWWRYA